MLYLPALDAMFIMAWMLSVSAVPELYLYISRFILAIFICLAPFIGRFVLLAFTVCIYLAAVLIDSNGISGGVVSYIHFRCCTGHIIPYVSTF